MNALKVIGIPLLLLAASLPWWGVAAFAEQRQGKRAANPHELSAADEKAIRDVIKAQEVAWNKHDMQAFTECFRDDADGINIVGMYWRGKAAILKHLSYYHATNFKDLEETLDEVNVHSIGDGFAIAIVIWKVGAFQAPNGVDIPAARHRSTQVLAKGTNGWKVVHFHNTTIDEAAVKGAAAAPEK